MIHGFFVRLILSQFHELFYFFNRTHVDEMKLRTGKNGKI